MISYNEVSKYLTYGLMILRKKIKNENIYLKVKRNQAIKDIK